MFKLSNILFVCCYPGRLCVEPYWWNRLSTSEWKWPTSSPILTVISHDTRLLPHVVPCSRAFEWRAGGAASIPAPPANEGAERGRAFSGSLSCPLKSCKAHWQSCDGHIVEVRRRVDQMKRCCCCCCHPAWRGSRTKFAHTIGSSWWNQTSLSTCSGILAALRDRGEAAVHVSYQDRRDLLSVPYAAAGRKHVYVESAAARPRALAFGRDTKHAVIPSTSLDVVFSLTI